jgi:hypothetical protein
MEALADSIGTYIGLDPGQSASTMTYALPPPSSKDD